MMPAIHKRQYIILLIPSLLVLLPALFGWYMYGLVNTPIFQFGWLIFWVWWWLKVTEDYKKDAGRIFLQGGSFVVIGLMIWGYGTSNLGAGMQRQEVSKPECYNGSAHYYTTKGESNGFFGFLEGEGRSYAETAPYFPYKRAFTSEELQEIKDCTTPSIRSRFWPFGN